MSAPGVGAGGRRLRRLAPGVHLATSAFWSTTTTILAGRGGGALVVDPGVLPGELAGWPGELAAAGLRPRAGACTHAHWDHVLWPRRWAGAPRYASAATVALLARAADQLVAAPLAAEAAARGVTWEPFDPAQDIVAVGAGQALPWEGPEVVAIVGDAHVPGHTSLLCEELGVLVAGDLLSDVDVPYPFFGPPPGHPEGLGPYRGGLDRLAPLLAGPAVRLVVPGHGTPTDAVGALARLDADRRYLDALEAAVAAAGTVEEARRAAQGIDARLADPAVRAAHDEAVDALFEHRPGAEAGASAPRS